jgi:catechol 2,3-dioxygenase-like lactoylglutathione lyase family enzyme
LFENRLPQLIVDLAVQRAGGLRLDPQGRHECVHSALQSGTLAAKVALYLLPFLDEQLQSMGKPCGQHKEGTMFSGGNVTVYVSNMDRAVRFYSETLGLKLAYRLGDPIGLHPASSENTAGRKGSMAIGLQLKGSLRDAVSALKAKGVHFQSDVINEGKAGSFIGFEDPDGNQLYLAELNWSHVEKGEGQYQPAKA